MSDPAEWLEAMGAPEALVAAVPADLESAWDDLERADWLVWVAGAASVSLDETLRVLSGLIAEALVAVPQAETIVMGALETAEACVRREATRAECEAQATVAESAAREAPATFRDAPPKAYCELAEAGGRVARAAEAIMSARLRDEAAQMERARDSAAYLGVGIDIFARRADPPARFDVERIGHPIHAELLFVVASLSEAARLLEQARAILGQPTGAALAFFSLPAAFAF